MTGLFSLAKRLCSLWFFCVQCGTFLVLVWHLYRNSHCLQGFFARSLFDAKEGLFDGCGSGRPCGGFGGEVRQVGAVALTLQSKVLAASPRKRKRGVIPVRMRWGRKAWEVRKPGPVRFRAAIIYLAPQLLVVSSDQPERTRLRAAIYAPASRRMSFCLFLLQVGFT